MKDKKEKLLSLILWKDILSIPTYTILFNYFINLFWIVLIIDRIVFLFINIKSINIDKI